MTDFNRKFTVPRAYTWTEQRKSLDKMYYTLFVDDAYIEVRESTFGDSWFIVAHDVPLDIAHKLDPENRNALFNDISSLYESRDAAMDACERVLTTLFAVADETAI